MERIRETNINTLDFWDGEHAVRAPEKPDRFMYIADFLKEHADRVGRPISILDIGCADGIAYSYFKQAGVPIANYNGTDFSSVAIDQARKKNPDGFFAVAHYDNQPFIPDCFDIVLSQEVFEHVERPQALAREMNRLVRPDGRIILSTPRGEHLNGCKEHIWKYDDQDIRDLFKGQIVEFAPRLSRLIIAIIEKPFTE